MMRWLWVKRFLTSMAVLAVVSLSIRAEAADASQFVRERQATVVAAATAPSSAMQRQQVRRALRAMFDYDAMARAVEHKRHWAKLSSADRAELHALVQEALLHQHEQLLDLVRRDELQLRVTGTNIEGSAEVISAVATTPDRATSYALAYTMGGSKVVDLAIEEVSLVRTWRTQIASQLRKHKLAELKTKLKARIATTPKYQGSAASPAISEEAATLLTIGLATAGAYFVTCSVSLYFGARLPLCTR